MLKIRLQGTTNELKWFRKILEKNSNFEILSISEPYANKGTNKYFRRNFAFNNRILRFAGCTLGKTEDSIF